MVASTNLVGIRGRCRVFVGSCRMGQLCRSPHAVPSELEKGTLQIPLSGVVTDLSKNSRSLKELLRVARDRHKIKRARRVERARNLRIEDHDQRLDREVTEGTGQSSSRDGPGNEPTSRQLNRVSVLTSLRENRAMVRTWAILNVTGGDPESRL